MQSGPSSAVEKRWLTITPRENGASLWPEGTIRYCFPDEATKEKLFNDLKAAAALWYSNGLPEESFKFNEVSRTECQSNRAWVLLIQYNDEGKLGTTPGIQPLDPSEPTYRGPSMRLSDKDNVGMLNVISNYAHELGHAWGLLHEHQIPYYWTAPYSPFPKELFTFDCQALKDYGSMTQKFADPNKQRELCTNRLAASKEKFTASDYLPILGGARSPGAYFPTDDDVDWESIMLYPSGAGGIGSASPGNDQRRPVLLRKSDGSKIPINLTPSGKDVNALKDLYSKNWPTINPTLLNEPSNPKQSKFKRIFGRQKCT